MEQDRDGWGQAPPADFWHCPECLHRAAVGDWQAEADTRKCPHCGYVYDLGQSGRLSQAGAAGRVPRDPDAPGANYGHPIEHVRGK